MVEYLVDATVPFNLHDNPFTGEARSLDENISLPNKGSVMGGWPLQQLDGHTLQWRGPQHSLILTPLPFLIQLWVPQLSCHDSLSLYGWIC